MSTFPLVTDRATVQNFQGFVERHSSFGRPTPDVIAHGLWIVKSANPELCDSFKVTISNPDQGDETPNFSEDMVHALDLRVGGHSLFGMQTHTEGAEHGIWVTSGDDLSLPASAKVVDLALGHLSILADNDLLQKVG